MAKFEPDLCDFLRIASLSAIPRKTEMASAAGWVAGQFRDMGFATETIATPATRWSMPSRPRCRGRRRCWSMGTTTCSQSIRWIFGPARRLSPRGGMEISTPAGRPTTRGRCSRTSPARAWLEVHGRLPIQLKYLIEGEEEVGSGAWRSICRESPIGWRAIAW